MNLITKNPGCIDIGIGLMPEVRELGGASCTPTCTMICAVVASKSPLFYEVSAGTLLMACDLVHGHKGPIRGSGQSDDDVP